MSRAQLLAICLCIGIVFFEATIYLGVMPVYVVRLGGDSATTGAFLAFQFLIASVGNLAAGWLSDRFGDRKRMIVISLLLTIPASLLITQATTVTEVILTTGLRALPAAFTFSALNILAGVVAAPSERGRVFGWITVASGAGWLITGLIAGGIAEQSGFPTLSIIVAAADLVMLVIVLFIQDTPTQLAAHKTETSTSAKISVSAAVYGLLVANLFVRLGITTSDLGRPLAMIDLGLDTAAVAGAIAFSSAVAVPLPLILGWLSDRIGRRNLLIAVFAIGSVGIFLLSVSALPWQFWLSASLIAITNSAGGVISAYVSDLAAPETLGRSMALSTSSVFLAGIIGLGGTGYVIQALGLSTTVILGAILPLIGIVLLLRMRQPAVAAAVIEQPAV